MATIQLCYAKHTFVHLVLDPSTVTDFFKTEGQALSLAQRRYNRYKNHSGLEAAQTCGLDEK